MSENPADYYPSELYQRDLIDAVDAAAEECFVSFVNVGVVIPDGRNCEIRGDIIRLGFLADGGIAFDMIDAICEVEMTVPLSWVDYWFAECWDDWPRDIPTRGEIAGLEFIMRDPLARLCARRKASEGEATDSWCG